ENQILPLLRKQKGFKDEITLSNPGSQDAIAITLWENKNNADDYNTNTYPQLLKTLANVIDGTPSDLPPYCAQLRLRSIPSFSSSFSAGMGAWGKGAG